jgi:hypothetical protein
MNVSRRTFLAGIGAIIVAASVAAPLPESVRELAPFTLPPRAPWPWFTAERLISVIEHLGAQVNSLGPLSDAERATVAAMIDDIIDQERPMGVQVNVTAPLEFIARGEFCVIEELPGVVNIAARHS